MLPSVLITIPTFNRPILTTRAIDSVLAQDYRGELDIFLYDDGSDQPYIYPEDHDVPGYEYIRTLHVCRGEVNRGIAFAKNQGMRDRGPDYDLHGVLDSDDAYSNRSFVSRCVAELMAHPDVVAVYTDNDRIRIDGVRVVEPAAEWSDEALPRCQLRGDCYLARWEALKRAGLHDERFELDVDYEILYGLAQQGPLRRIPEVLMTVHDHSGQTTRDRSKAAFWHAAGLGKYGHSIDWALQRAAAHPEWLPAIREGYAFGESIRAPR